MRLAAAGVLAALLALLLIIPVSAAGASVASGPRLAVRSAAGIPFSVARQAVTGTVTTGASDASGAAPNAVEPPHGRLPRNASRLAI